MRFQFFFLLVLLTAFSNNALRAAPGDLDTTFGTGGKTILSQVNGIAFDTFTGSGFVPTKIALQTDGKVIIVGNRNTGIQILLIVARINADGTPDTSFGTNGVASTSFGDYLSLGTDVVIQPDGKIVVVGIASAGFGADINFAIARYNPNGSPDTGFNGNGRVVTSFDGNLFEGALAVSLQTDGKILACGTSLNENTEESRFAISRYNSNGSLDTGFDGDGKLLLMAGDPLETSNVADALALQTDGKIIVGGQTGTTTTSRFALVRLLANGSFDTSFDTDGKVQTQINGFGIEVIRALAIQTDGKIISAGQTDVESRASFEDDDFALTRYNPDGSLDTNFSADGKLTFSFGDNLNFEQAYDVLVDPAGRIIIGGFSGTIAVNGTISTNVAVARLQANGNFDVNFGNQGRITTVFTDPVNLGSGLALQPDGKILLGGVSGTNDLQAGDFSPIFARYEGGPAVNQPDRTPFDFDGDGKTDISIFRPAVGEWWYLRSSDNGNQALQFGTASDRIAPADFTGDGKTDVAFWRETTGEWFIVRSEDASFYSFPFGANGDIPVPADFDGDGRDDPAIFRPSNQTWYILNSGGGTTITTFGANGDRPVPADYDGDDKTDIAIFRPSDGSWWLNRSSAGLVVYTFGTGTDKTVPADYSGDGRADVAFFRPSTNEWFILRSEDTSFFSFPFGAPGDIPTPGDYDGDGKADPTVFRPSNNTWFKLQSASGFEAVTFGLTNDIPVPGAFVR